MKCFAITALALIITCVTGLARLGDTVEEIEKRYGKPPAGVQTNAANASETFAMYFTEDMTILVIFKNGKSANESISKTRGDKKEITEAEIAVLLQVNSGASKWLRPEEQSVTGKRSELIVWKRADGLALATLTLPSKDRFSVFLLASGLSGF